MLICSLDKTGQDECWRSVSLCVCSVFMFSISCFSSFAHRSPTCGTVSTECKQWLGVIILAHKHRVNIHDENWVVLQNFHLEFFVHSDLRRLLSWSASWLIGQSTEVSVPLYEQIRLALEACNLYCTQMVFRVVSCNNTFIVLSSILKSIRTHISASVPVFTTACLH